MLIFFFFSSRRRHTRLQGDWSSDVCSSDLRTAVARARRGEGPTLVEAVTYRWGGHSMRANLPEYRTKEEEREWMERDPIARLGSHLGDGKRATPARLKELAESVERELDRAGEFAKASP